MGALDMGFQINGHLHLTLKDDTWELIRAPMVERSL